MENIYGLKKGFFPSKIIFCLANFISDSLDSSKSDTIRRLILIPIYSWYCKSTSWSPFNIDGAYAVFSDDDEAR